VAVVDAATFGCSALCLLLLHTREPEPARAEHHFLTELAAGVRYVGRTIPLRQIVLTVAAALLVFGFTETLIFAIVTQGLHRPPSFLGVLATTQGIGAIAGGLTAGQLLRHLGDARLVALGLAVAGTGVALTVASSLPAVVLGIVIAGAAIPWAIVGFGTAIQLRTPAHLQGRVYSAADTMVGTPQTISIALGAGLSTLVDYRLLLLVITAVTLGCAAYLATRQIPAALEAPSEVPLQPLEASELPPQAG
jgi:MFS family permease